MQGSNVIKISLTCEEIKFFKFNVVREEQL